MRYSFSITTLNYSYAPLSVTIGDDKINIFKNLDKEQYKSARSTIIDMILATEMTRHFEHLAKFVSVFGGEETREVSLLNYETVTLIKSVKSF